MEFASTKFPDVRLSQPTSVYVPSVTLLSIFRLTPASAPSARLATVRTVPSALRAVPSTAREAAFRVPVTFWVRRAVTLAEEAFSVPPKAVSASRYRLEPVRFSVPENPATSPPSVRAPALFLVFTASVPVPARPPPIRRPSPLPIVAVPVPDVSTDTKPLRVMVPADPAKMFSRVAALAPFRVIFPSREIPFEAAVPPTPLNVTVMVFAPPPIVTSPCPQGVTVCPPVTEALPMS